MGEQKKRFCMINKYFRTIVSGCCFLICVFLMLPFSCMESRGKEEEQRCQEEIVILLDCSKSMEDVDELYRAFDFVKGLSAAALRDCKVGFVAYNDGVCAGLPPGTAYISLMDELEGLEYRRYGNAGAGLDAAVGMFGKNEAKKRIILISDGEIMMESDGETAESADLFQKAVSTAKDKKIKIDVLALGDRLEGGNTVYGAAEETGGRLYELAAGEELPQWIKKYLLEEWDVNQSHIGKINGVDGELTVRLPDCLMETAKIVLLGKQQNENLTVNCEAEKIDVRKGEYYTVIELLHPASEEVKIRTSADESMDIDGYLMAEYDFMISVEYAFGGMQGEKIQETKLQETKQQNAAPQEDSLQEAEIYLTVSDMKGRNLLEGHLGNGRLEIYLNGEKQEYKVVDGRACMKKVYTQDGMAQLEVKFPGGYGSYYGERETEVWISVPVIEEEPEEMDWFFWCVIVVFIIALGAMFYISYRRGRGSGHRKKVVDESRETFKQPGFQRNDFCGKIVVYIIRNKEDIDYPPESINLFARCNREMITLEWILDVCNIPLNLDGAERIVIKPGADKSLVIKNSSKASALMGRELLIKGRSYHLYYHEKITFLFDQDDAEIEIHYKNLKPNER